MPELSTRNYPQVAGEYVRRQGLECDVRILQGPQRVAGVEAGSDVLLAGRFDETLQLPSLESPAWFSMATFSPAS